MPADAFSYDPTQPVILMDLGATYLRMAVYDSTRQQGPLGQGVQVAVADYPDLIAAIRDYQKVHNTAHVTQIAVATAANETADGRWLFSTGQQWMNNAAELMQAGFTVSLISDDFVARARGAITLSPDESVQLVKGQARIGLPKAIIGVGSGLGLAYIIYPQPNKPFVQYNFGGHMLMAAVTDEQKLVIDLCQKMKGAGATVIPEDFLSGAGLTRLYDIYAHIHGYPAKALAPADLLPLITQDPIAQGALRLFHEFLGLFVHHAVMSGHAFGGVFLDGGVIQHLVAANLLDIETVRRFYLLPGAKVVEEHLAGLPVRLIETPNVTLRGLQAFLHEELRRDAA